MDELTENFDRETENIKKNQSELKNTITEMTNTLEGINNGLRDTVEQISKLEDRVVENTQAEQKKRILKHEDSVRDLWDNIKSINIYITVVSEGKREVGAENLLI